MRGGISRKLDAWQPLFSLKVDVCCFVETLLTEHNVSPQFPGHTCLSVCRSVTQCASDKGGISVYMADRFSKHAKLWRNAANSSYVWLRLPHGQTVGCETYLCICYMAPRNSAVYRSNES